MYNEIIDRGLEPDNVTYTALVPGLLNSGHTEKSIILYNEISSNGMKPAFHIISNSNRRIIKARKVQLQKYWVSFDCWYLKLSQQVWNSIWLIPKGEAQSHVLWICFLDFKLKLCLLDYFTKRLSLICFLKIFERKADKWITGISLYVTHLG